MTLFGQAKNYLRCTHRHLMYSAPTKITGTPPCILNGLRYQCYTITKHIMIFFMILSGNQNVVPQFDKGVKGGYFTLMFSTAILIL